MAEDTKAGPATEQTGSSSDSKSRRSRPTNQEALLETTRKTEALETELKVTRKLLGQRDATIGDLRSQIGNVKRDIEELRNTSKDADLYGDDEEAKANARKVREALRQAEETSDKLLSRELAVTAKELAQSMGVPEAEFVGLDDPKDMRLKAYEWKMEQGRTNDDLPTAPQDSINPPTTVGPPPTKTANPGSTSGVPNESWRDLSATDKIAAGLRDQEGT